MRNSVFQKYSKVQGVTTNTHQLEADIHWNSAPISPSATKFYRKLAEAMRHGATITEEIMLNGLTNEEAYRIEKQKIEEFHKQNRDQLWNTIDERLIGITWKEFKRKQRAESFQRRWAGLVGGSAGPLSAGFLSELRALDIDLFLRQQGPRHHAAGKTRFQMVGVFIRSVPGCAPTRAEGGTVKAIRR